ncbi:hypothetical protein [Delftia sp. PE138]|uniref:hypothetical protein n=1 Tax=Delftia sp. PE138 TaxID=1812483 RepID=UPI001BAE7893|nr:hypothetical protein [Delftia sp. PE138]MBS3719445.1 hypothetical protein [Delftia sp. PE138]
MDNKTVESNKRLAENLRKLADRVEARDQLVYYSASAAVPDPVAALPGGELVYQRPVPMNLVIVMGDKDFVSRETQ